MKTQEMLIKQIQSVFLLIIFLFLNTMLTLSWSKSWTSPVLYEEIKELAGGDETNDLQSVNIDFIFSEEAIPAEELSILLIKQPFAHLNSILFNSYIQETYSPPEA